MKSFSWSKLIQYHVAIVCVKTPRLALAIKPWRRCFGTTPVYSNQVKGSIHTRVHIFFFAQGSKQAVNIQCLVVNGKTVRI